MDNHPHGVYAFEAYVYWLTHSLGDYWYVPPEGRVLAAAGWGTTDEDWVTSGKKRSAFTFDVTPESFLLPAEFYTPLKKG